MSSNATPSVLATATSLLALTTPFVQPPGCDTHWTTTSFQSRTDGTRLTFPLAVSEPVASCYPSGWETVVPESRLHFTPAVCPDGWTYFSMGEDWRSGHTTAFCCNSGYTLQGWSVNEIATSMESNLCRRWVPSTDTAVNSAEESNATPSGQTLMVHEPWAVTWAASDTPTLTPQLPTITNSMLVPTWTPGQVIPDGLYDTDDGTRDHPHPLSKGALWFLIVGMPIIGAILIGLCVWGCVRKCKKNRREKALKRAAGGPSEGKLVS